MEKFKFFRERCLGCCSCVLSCPLGAIEMTDDDNIIIDEDSCCECKQCVEACPVDALVSK